MTARIVAVGHVKPEHGTLTVQFATGEPIWTPDDQPEEPDWDLYRKQQIEDELGMDW